MFGDFSIHLHVFFCLIFGAGVSYCQHALTTPMTFADVKECPFLLLTPSNLHIDAGKRATFAVVEEAKLEPILEARWIYSQNRYYIENSYYYHSYSYYRRYLKYVNKSEERFQESKLLPTPKLVIHDADIDDTGYYGLEVRIAEGWCTSKAVFLEVRGILQYHDPCNRSRECDSWKHALLCSPVYEECLCSSGYYHRNQTCYWGSYLGPNAVRYIITTSSISVNWTKPYRDSDLIQSYSVELRDRQNSTLIANESVGNLTSHTFNSYFIPGAIYDFYIISIALLSDPVEIFKERSGPWIFIVEPLPPGPLDSNASNFHPEHLFLEWTVPGNNTLVRYYRVTIDLFYDYTKYNNITWQQRLEPGRNYTVTIVTMSCDDYYDELHRYYYENNHCTGKDKSINYQEQIMTLRTPTLNITSEENVTSPYLSTLKITAEVIEKINFPPATKVKWQKLRNGNVTDIDIKEGRYNGSTEDLSSPLLVINRVDFDTENGSSYQCLALNSEGWGSSLSMVNVTVVGSLKFQEQCNRSRECIPDIGLECRSNQCLCNSSFYHKDSICYNRNALQAQSIQIESSTCNISIKWDPPSQDGHLISGYQILWQENSFGSWMLPENVSIGNQTEYTTPCSLRPGRLYKIHIRSEFQLKNPSQIIYVDSYSSESEVILAPMPPGPLTTLSNYSADNLYLRWNDSENNSFVNRYKVMINGHEQMTEGAVPEISWEELLEPFTKYNVTITAISYGYTTNYPWNGTRESSSSEYEIKTHESRYSGDAYIPYGNEDFILTGDEKISQRLNSPTTVYIGNGTEGGFTFVTIGTNGIIGLGEEFNSADVHELDYKKMKNRKIICPFWVDLNSSDSHAKVYYNAYKRVKDEDTIDSMFMQKADGIVKKYFKDYKDFKATWLVKVTWQNMSLISNSQQKITVQCLLITDGENTFAVFNYLDVNLNPVKKLKIVMGYRYKKFLIKNPFSNQKGAFKMTSMPGNTGEPGIWIYKMSEGVQSVRDEKECFLWYTNNKDTGHRLSSIQCPCDNGLLRFDPRYEINRLVKKKNNRLLCYASMTIGRNTECCYKMYADTAHLGPLERSEPLAGTVLKYNPFFERFKYSNYDMKPRNQCCKTGHCDWYYELRPIPQCYVRSPFQPGINFGDPHITTLDGKNYTFNGYGEYTMMKINTSEMTFDLQARTDLASTENGTTTNATIFSAFVAQDQTGSKVQVEMSRDKKGMIIKGNEIDLTTKFDNANYSFLTQNLSLRWQNQSISATFLNSGITIKVSIGKRFLICETLVNEMYKTRTLGLMGNFDGNATNDFILPDGTVLSENETKTERLIFNNFGQKWSVENRSLFQYDDGLTFKNFSHPEFVPIFTDEVDNARKQEAEKKCGPKPSQACIFDYLATGDISLAESSGNKAKESKSDLSIIENETPQLSGNTTIHVEVNKEAKLIFNASDDGINKPKLKLQKQPANFTLNNITATWTPSNFSAAEISLIAEDDKGAQSASLDITIVLCPGCENGECDFENRIKTEVKRFFEAPCKCDKGYTGETCADDSDACLQSPCPHGRNCTDLTPSEEVRLQRGYNCSECPTGFNEIDNKCRDIDECVSSKEVCDPTTETCENTEGGFICNCVSGYRKSNNACIDVNECQEGLAKCEQKCTNTKGSFNCSCHAGYDLNIDGKKCDKTETDPCKNTSKKCEYACISENGNFQCICMNGYRLEENGNNCTDIDECDNTPTCEQKCINTEGSFECACKPGFHLNEDKTSCTECTIPNYGENCSQIYSCGQGGNRYDPVRGCICNEGWRGSDCNEDIDECFTTPHVCGLSKICQNLQGSYKCVCQDGFQLQGDACTDIDECVDESLNDCPQSTTVCQNVYGNYTCECQIGYEKNKNGECKDIDECKNGRRCSQICNNVDGGYNCGCYFGFTLGNDRMTCEKVGDSCSLFPELNCTYGCKIQHDNQGVCFCEHGYKLDVDNRTCIDINECALNSSCDHNCTNTNGSFECQCAVGFKLQNDGKSCRECSKFFYGENCQMPCKCGRGASTCDHISGCQCKPGWKGNTCEHDINECDHNPCKGPHEICLNTPGSYRCTCAQGFDNSTGICEDTDECRDKSLCQHNCTNTEGNYTCSCMDGYKLSNGKDCSDIDECSTAKCHNCSNFPGGFKCFCDEGYRVNSTYCHNIDECKENTDNCSGNATCTDTTGSFGCECFNGFSGNGYVCIEINECANHTDNCSVNANCTNTIGSFRCNCLSGFDGDGYNCEDVDECTKYHNCSGYATCENTIGSYKCSCNKGYQGNGFSCGDIDECKESNECSPYALCNNTDGSYNCNCKDGFSGDGYNCTDIDECVQAIHNCSENASCSNTNGSFHCTCLKGFRGNGYLCEDIDECKEDNNTCTQNAICTNLVGSHICSCSDGFKENGHVCEDVNECTDNIHNCSKHAICNNTKGNYDCLCNMGFQGNGYVCKDVDECAATANSCHVNATCENTAGNYSCSCQRGFKGNGVICTGI
ncbi:uncharacterized protein LOC134241103 [Saccostrea cucullata]|uniref:uncharacterized protein LOC134241103 n=1 Tax=Saccostrea cuccullata TaxID=36930 RepID=UPI002ED4C5A4